MEWTSVRGGKRDTPEVQGDIFLLHLNALHCVKITSSVDLIV